MERCEIIRDLLPVCADGLASDATYALVQAHTANCEACRTLLEDMSRPMPIAPMQRDGFVRALKKQKRAYRRKGLFLAVAAVLLVALVCLAAAWWLDVFWLADRQISPDGKTVTTVYTRDITDTIPKKGYLTLVDRGYFAGRTVLNGEFEGLWWSADSNFQVVSHLENGVRYLTLFDYVRNTGSNLDNRLDQGIYGREEFAGVVYPEPGRPDIEYSFLQWSRYDSNMLVTFQFLDKDGIDRDGYFWYNYATGEVTGVVFLPTMVMDGIVERVDEMQCIILPNGGEEPVVVALSSATILRGLDTVSEGESVRVVCRVSEELSEAPWDMVFGPVRQDDTPVAVSISKLN